MDSTMLPYRCNLPLLNRLLHQQHIDSSGISEVELKDYVTWDVLRYEILKMPGEVGNMM